MSTKEYFENKRNIPDGIVIVKMDVPSDNEVISSLEELSIICTPGERKIINQTIGNIKQKQYITELEEQLGWR